MAVCALVSGRIRDGSVTNPRWDLNPLRHPPPDVFYAEAQRQLVEIGSEASLHVLRAHAILAIAAIQNGRIRDMHQHLGTYHTLVAMDALHDEANWPINIGLVEREERRRLFWSIYTLDVYTSVVWGGILRSREQQSSVAYPMEIDDDLIIDDSHHGAQSPTSASSSSTCRALLDKTQSWMKGWNFITDLYRVLEHALTRFRSHSNRSRRQSLILHEIFDDDKSGVTEASVRDRVLQLYLDLPACFRETPDLTYIAKKDLFGYQAANIKASLQLVRMVLFAAAGASIEERCQIVREVLNAFVSVPVAYLVAISTPLLHHLGGIGVLLGSVLEEPLSQQDYGQVRSLLLSMAQLLESLEAIRHSASASEKLRLQVSRIDEYMATQRHVAPSIDIHNSGSAFMSPETTSAAAAATSASMSLQQPQQPQQPPQIETDMEDGWSFQVPAELLGGLSWTFDFGT
ncbi:hypothetical protein CDD82_5919 [Ophiocordyceps australis]|uniref:Xylanolytic transcriptional activator regulatory domain-containing protein n=1 Tax=Ophiocordyceps australis TaxID=1399860 RepID=A0A2C5XHG3_9HYPO|nr:hypothetical protein CDD82_5919 [Ophiocordyceps australis]